MLPSICGQQMPRSACASAQSDQGLHCPITESLDTTEYMNWDQRPGWSESARVAHARRYYFSLEEARMFWYESNKIALIWSSNNIIATLDLLKHYQNLCKGLCKKVPLLMQIANSQPEEWRFFFLFCQSLFLLSPFSVLGMLYFVIVAFP